LKAAQQEAQRLGLTLTDADEHGLKDMINSWRDFTALVSAFTQKIGAAVAPAFAELLTSVKQLMTQIVTDFQTLPIGDAINSTFSRLGGAFQRLGDFLTPIMLRVGFAIGNAIVEGIYQAVSQSISQIFSGLGTELQQNFRILVTNLARIGQLITEHLVDPTVAALTEIGDFFQNVWDKIVQTGTAAWNAITQAAIDAFHNLTDPIVQLVNSIIDVIQQAIDKAKVLWSYITGNQQASAADGGGGSGLPAAGGGLITGPGTATSDSIPAWLSTGEFVMRASAVRTYGAGLMHALNSLQAPRFAAGGLNLGHAAPRFATASVPVSGQRVLNLSIEGRSFSGLSIPENTAKSLERFAVNSQIASTGRKPSWRR
jgi:hypothetical protein